MTTDNDVEQLTSPQPFVVTTASDTQAGSASGLLADFMRIKHGRNRAFKGLIATSVALNVANFALFVYLNGKIPVELFLSLLIVGNLIAIAPLGVASSVLMFRPSERQRGILSDLSRIVGVEAIPPLWESLAYSDKRLSTFASERLIRLLPLATMEHVTLFTDQQLRGLSLLPLHSVSAKFKDRIDERLATACLAAVAVIGDERNVEDLRKIIAYGAQSDRERRIQAEGQLSLAVLDARLAVESRGGNLLRPATDAGSDELLRPAASGQADTGALLLPAEPRSDGET